MPEWWRPAVAAVGIVAALTISLAWLVLASNPPSKDRTQPTNVTAAQASDCLTPHDSPEGYHYVTVLECGFDFKEASASLTLPQKLPNVDPHGHSIGEIAMWQPTQKLPVICAHNAIEAGWIAGTPEPDKKIRFFVKKTVAFQENYFASKYAPDGNWVSLGSLRSPTTKSPRVSH